VNAFRLALVAVTVVLSAACGSTGAAPSASASGSGAPCGPPRLTILEPVAGATVRAPLQVRFRVACFRVGPAPGGHLHAWVGPPASSRRFELTPTGQAGVVEVPDPLLSGRQTLTFQLAHADHTAVANPEARVVVREVVFEGP
jgi:hypothetical protein